MLAPLPVDEPERLRELHDLRLLDSPPDPRLFDVVRVVARQCGTPMAGVTVVGAEWRCLAGVGLHVYRAPREVSMCAHTICGTGVLEVPDARADPRFADNPYVVAGVVGFYAGAPLVTDSGHTVGALCVGDRVPRRLSEAQRDLLRVLADQVSIGLQVHRRVDALEAADRAGELEEFKQEVLALISHELRTPIASIRSSLEILADTQELTPQVATRLLPPIQRNAARLLDTLDRLLLAARVSTTRAGLLSAVIDLVELANEAAVRTRQAALRRQVRVVVDAASPVPVLGDHALLANVLVQVLVNAIVHGPAAGQVTIRAYADPVPTIEVTDDGPGIPEAERAAVFGAFHRAQPARLQHTPGLGLGLTIAKAIIEAHNGTISVDSQPPGGSTVRVSLPIPLRPGQA